MGESRTKPPRIDGTGQKPGADPRFVLEVSADRLSAAVLLRHGAGGAPCNPELIADFVHRSGLALSAEEEGRLPELAAQLCDGAAQSILVAQGAPAGTWPEIDWLIPMGVTSLRDYSRETIDLHEVSQFINVRQGQALCLLPAPPAPGRDVFGEPIPPPACPLQLGDRVAVDPGNAAKVLATESGCARFIDGRLSVEQVFELPGDLTFKVGNIDFHGAVIIHGNVADGFRVRCTKDLVIDGGVGMSTLEAGGSLVIKGGVNGGGKGKLVCGSHLQVHYLHKVNVECGGDVSVDVESHDSHIRAGGTCTVTRGGIIGGSVLAGKGITAGFIGANMAVPTLVHAGYNPDLDGAIAEPRKRLAVSRVLVRSLESMQTDLLGRPGFTPRYPSQTKTQLTQVHARLTDALIVLRNAQGQVQARSQGVPLAGASITAQKRIFPKVTLVVDSLCEEEITEERMGPAKLIANSDALHIEPVAGPGSAKRQ